MTETVARMFSLMATRADRLSECWTPGKADTDLLAGYAAAGPPLLYAFPSVTTRGRDGVLYAGVRVRAIWAGRPPPEWGVSELQQVVLRQQRDWSWTIDAIRPRTREAMATDPHCGVCHR